MKNTIGIISIIVGLLVMTSVPTNAALTEPQGPDSPSGKVLFKTLDSLYGLDNLTRINDYDSAVVDQYWAFADETVTATAIARTKLTGLVHDLGFLPGPKGDKFQSFFNTGPSPYSVFDKEPISKNKKKASFTEKETGPIFRFGLELFNQPGHIWSSAPCDNIIMSKDAACKGIDHMITFQVTGNDGYANNKIGNYIISWENPMANNILCHSDGNYGDLLVELSGVQSIPEPYSITLFALAGLALLRHSRRTKIT